MELIEVQLKNGSSEMRQLVAGVMMNLKSLLNDASGAIAFYELHEICKNPEHQIFSVDALQKLQRRELLDQNGKVHDSIKNIVLSATEGEGANLCLGNPIAG